MTDKQEKEIDRALQAQKIIDHPLFIEAFDTVRQALIDKIEQAPIRDTEGAEKARYLLKLLRDVRAVFEQALRDGKFSSAQLETKRRWYERLKDVGN